MESVTQLERASECLCEYAVLWMTLFSDYYNVSSYEAVVSDSAVVCTIVGAMYSECVNVSVEYVCGGSWTGDGRLFTHVFSLHYLASS